MSAAITITPASLTLLLAFVADSGNWSNNPMVDVSEAEKGNLTHLKKVGLVATFKDEGIDWLSFKFTNVEVTDGARVYRLENCEDYSTASLVEGGAE